ncbi:MAG: glycosyltransferase family 2 protein [Lutibacter sp.]
MASKVSVIIPSYNHSSFLIDRLETIANQTNKDWEAIIIDDKSTDNSVEIITQFIKENPDFKVKHFIVNENNSGSGYTSWQKGIELAKTEYIWIAETDDYSDTHFLEEQINVLEKTDAALSFCASNYVDEDGKQLYNSDKRTSDLGVKKGDYKVFESKVFTDKMPFETYITNGSSVVFRKPDGKIPEELFTYKQCSDIFLWTYLLNNNCFVFLNLNLNYFRRHEDSTSTKISKFMQESVYFEKAEYLNYFNQTSKYKIFINHYITYYVLINKWNIIKTKSLQRINNVKYIKIKYSICIFKVFLSKLIIKLTK